MHIENLPSSFQNLLLLIQCRVDNIPFCDKVKVACNETQCVSDYVCIDDDNHEDKFAAFKIRKHLQPKYFVYDYNSATLELLKGFEYHYFLASILLGNIGIDTSNFEPEELEYKTCLAPHARADELF